MSVEIEWIGDFRSDEEFTDSPADRDERHWYRYAAIEGGALAIIKTRRRPKYADYAVVHAMFGPATWARVKGDHWPGPLPQD